MARSGVVAGLKVLVVEDETVICMMIEDMLTDLGCIVVGSANNIERALALAGAATLDIAVLDINLRGVDAGPVADRLAARGVPFIFASGYGRDGVSPAHLKAPALRKPFTEHDLARALAEAMEAEGRASRE
jgi:CheY-like chemotaxis protein